MTDDTDITKATALLRWCVRELIYKSPNSIHEQISTDKFKDLDFDVLKRRVELCKRILTLPNPPDNSKPVTTRLPRGWKNDIEAITASQHITDTTSDIDKMIAKLNCEIDADFFDEFNIGKKMNGQILITTITEIIIENGLKCSDFWKEVRERFNSAISC